MTQERYRRVVMFALLMCLVFPFTVRAGDRFTDNGDGTVTDHRMGLMWAKNDNNGNINWKEANQWVRYTFPDTIPVRYEGWRLPTLEELKSLYVNTDADNEYEADCGQRVKIVPGIRLSCGFLWTADENEVTAAVFNFTRGIHYTDRKVHYRAYRVLPVRDLD